MIDAPPPPQGVAVSNDEMRSRLLAASWFLIAYELLKGEIVDRPQELFRQGWAESGPIMDPRYDTEVRSLSKYKFDASLLWLQRQGALSENEVSDAHEVRSYRNRIAHELFGMLMTPDQAIDRSLLEMTATLIARLGRYWARQPLPPFGPVAPPTPDSEIFSSKMFIVGFFAQVAGLTSTKSR